MIELKIANEADRLTVANILVKNGYAVCQKKTKDEGEKTATYKLRVFSMGDDNGTDRTA